MENNTTGRKTNLKTENVRGKLRYRGKKVAYHAVGDFFAKYVLLFHGDGCAVRRKFDQYTLHRAVLGILQHQYLRLASGDDADQRLLR